MKKYQLAQIHYSGESMVIFETDEETKRALEAEIKRKDSRAIDTGLYWDTRLAPEVYNHLAKYLCEQGFERFAASGQEIFFRRSDEQ